MISINQLTRSKPSTAYRLDPGGGKPLLHWLNSWLRCTRCGGRFSLELPATKSCFPFPSDLELVSKLVIANDLLIISANY